MKNPFKKTLKEVSYDINIKDKKTTILSKDVKKYNIGDVVDLTYYKNLYSDIKLIQDKIRKDLNKVLFYFDIPEYKEAEDACKILFGRKYITEEEVMKLNNYIRSTAKNTFEDASKLFEDAKDGLKLLSSFKSNMHLSWFGILLKIILFAVAFFLWSILNGIFQKLIKPILLFKFLGSKPLKPMADKLQKIIDKLKPKFDLSGNNANANAQKLFNTYTSSIVDNTSNTIEDAQIIKYSSIILNTIFKPSYIIDKEMRRDGQWIGAKGATVILYIIGLNKLTDITDETLATDLAS